MKPQWNKKYTTIAVYTAIVLLAGVLFVFFFLKFDEIGGALSKVLKICAPLIYGAFLAYILKPLVKLYEEKVFRSDPNKPGLSRTSRRILSVSAAMLTFFLFLILFIWMILPHLVDSVKELGAKLPSYIESLQEFADSIAANGGIFATAVNTILTYINDFVDRSYDLLSEYLPKLTERLQSVASAVFDIVLGVIFAVYFLAAKERISSQAKKFIRAFFPDRYYQSILETVTLADRTFGRYFTGAILDSILVGVICFIMMQILRMPYSPLISVIIGVTNIIPIFGPFIGAVPSAIILFVHQPVLAIYFILMILVLQQIDGNIIAPRIHGASTGLAPVWVIVSITLMSGLFGVVGMFIGVPVFSVIYVIVKRKIEEKLMKKSMPVDTLAYMSETNRRLYESKGADTGKSKKEKFKEFFSNFRSKIKNLFSNLTNKIKKNHKK